MNDERELPRPFLRAQQVESKESTVNRVTFRIGFIREIGGEEYQTFPPSNYANGTLKVKHRDAAYTLPTKVMGQGEIYKVDTGWITKPTLVAILNRTRLVGTSKPSKEEIEEVERQVLLVGFSKTDFQFRIPPGMLQPLYLNKDVSIYIKPEHGTPTISIFAV